MAPFLVVRTLSHGLAEQPFSGNLHTGQCFVTSNTVPYGGILKEKEATRLLVLLNPKWYYVVFYTHLFKKAERKKILTLIGRNALKIRG